MKVNRNGYIHMTKKLEMVKKLEKSSSVEKKDIIEISSVSLKINEYLKNSDTSGAEKIEKIKSKLNQGTYKVDSGKLAEKILEKINNQKIEDK